MRTVRLEFHDTTANSHKFYRLDYFSDGTVKASWGRIGTAGQSTTYAEGDAAAKLNEKLSKGYVVVSTPTPEVFPVRKSRPAPTPRPKTNVSAKASAFLNALDEIDASQKHKRS